MSIYNRSSIAQTGELPFGQVLRDTWPLTIIESKSTISEGLGGATIPTLKVRGLFQRADAANANGRVYGYSILREAIDEIQDEIKQRKVLGELDHPADAKIHLDRVSHLITNLWLDGKNVYGEAEILANLPFGKQLKDLLESKVVLGISSRGVGDLEVREHNGEEMSFVMPGFRFVTWDCVAEPSVHGAYINLAESKNRKSATAKQQPTNDVPKRIKEQLLTKAIADFIRD